MDHPAIHISGYLPPVARHKMVLRRNYTYLRWSSGLEGVPDADMVMMAVCRSAWHAIGVRIGTLSSYIGRSYSTGEVRLNSPDPDDEPNVTFNWLSDKRDLDRMVNAFRRMASILNRDPVPQYMSNLFASKFSQRVRSISQKNFKNTVLTNVAAMMMDGSASLRKFLFDKVISDARRCPSCSPMTRSWSGMCATTSSPPGIRPARAGWAIRQMPIRWWIRAGGSSGRRICSSPMRR